MKRNRFTPTAFCVAFVTLALAAPPGWLISPNRGAAIAADGIKANQEIVVQYVVGAKTVKARAILTPDGNLRFTFPTEDGLDTGWVFYKLTRQDVGPTPDPGPKPKPDPPTPVKRVTDFYIVWETADATPGQAAIRNASAWKDEATKLKMKWSQFDFDTIKGIAKFKAVTEAAAGKLPCVVKVDEDGKATTEPLPKTPAAMLELVRRVGKP